MKLGNATKAWQEVYNPIVANVRRRHPPRHAKPHVKRYLHELQERQMKKSDISIDKVLTDCQLAFDMAKGQQKAGDMIPPLWHKQNW